MRIFLHGSDGDLLYAKRQQMALADPGACHPDGITELYIGIHYPTDVLAGALTGALCGRQLIW